MQFNAKSGSFTSLRTPCLIAGVYQGGDLPESTREMDHASGGHISQLLGKGGFNGQSGRHLLLFGVPGLRAERLLLVGLGDPAKFNLSLYRKAVYTAAKGLVDAGVREATTALAMLDLSDVVLSERARHLVEATEWQMYRFYEMKSKKPADAPHLQKMTLLTASRSESTSINRAIAQGSAIAQGTQFARTLGNLPANVCTPTYLAGEARKLARKFSKLKTTVLSEADMKKLGMGTLLGVARGSRQAPKLILMEYSGTKKSAKPIALVGKGITFDAGGISLKPPAKMDEMKFDMCGAASVFGAVLATCELDLPINLVGIVASCENLPDGNAVKPGDVLKSMSGQTVEVLNTDAEGRLILADALTYAERYKPEAVVNMATLTGACVIALGHVASGLMSKDDKLAMEIESASHKAADPAWRLPLWDDYQTALESNFADFANVGGRDAGAITAGCFLSRFTENYRWAHLDIAGTAWDSGANKGATGRPVPLLAQWLLDRAGIS